jgi:hypothetical protein
MKSQNMKKNIGEGIVYKAVHKMDVYSTYLKMEVIRCKLLKVFHIILSQKGAIQHQNCPTILTEMCQAEF